MRNVAMPEAAFQTMQRNFAARIRQPQRQPLPEGVTETRMAVYSELFFNNVASFLADSFPVIHRLLPHEHWQEMTHDFFARHACRTPLFTRLGEEFLRYLQQERGWREEDPLYLSELAHYEWVELALTLSEAESLPEPSACAVNLLRSTLQLSPLAWLLSYRFPVHLIGGEGDVQNIDESPQHLLVYRDREDRVVFLEIDAMTHVLLSVLKSVGEVTTEELLATLAEQSGCASPGEFIDNARVLLESLIERGVIGVVNSVTENGFHEGKR